jgi:hypothetical protein
MAPDIELSRYVAYFFFTPNEFFGLRGESRVEGLFQAAGLEDGDGGAVFEGGDEGGAEA